MPMRRNTPIPEASAMALGMSVLLCLSVGYTAEERERRPKVDPANKPILVVFLVADSVEDRTREQRFINQLRLALDDFDIEPVELSVEDYASLPLYRKLTLVREHSDRLDAVATTWVENADTDTVMLHMVALSTGRAFVRIVEAHRGPAAEEELAFAAQELIGQVYLLSSFQEGRPVERVVEAVMEKAVLLRETRVDLRWAIMPFSRVSGGIWEHEGPWLRGGGGVSLELRVAEHFHLRVSVAGLAGPFHEPRDGVVDGWGLMPGLCFGFDWPAGPFRLGPVVGVSVARSVLHMTLGDGDSQTYRWWDFQSSLGIDLRWPLNETLSIVVTPSAGVWTKRRTFMRISDDSIVIASPLIDWSTVLGLLVSL